MTRSAIFITAILAAAAAHSAPMASEGFVTNKIAAAIAAIPAPDFSTSNDALVATIQATAPAPGDYATVSNKAMTALQEHQDISGKLDKSGGTLSGGITVWGDSTFYGNVFSFNDSFKIKFMDAVMAPYFEIFGYDISLPFQSGTLALVSDIPTSMAWDAITGKPTTISGYGITDALKSEFTSLTNNAAFTSAVAAVSPPTDLTHVEAEIETNRTAIATLSARAYIEVVSADEVYYVFTTNQE